MKFKSVIILCGGLGTRLGTMGKKMPKTLIKIHGKPIIWYIIKYLEKQSFNHFILPLGHKGSMIKKYFNNNKDYNTEKIVIDLVNTGKTTSISKRIFKIKNKIKSQNFILLNGDAIFSFNIKENYKKHLNKKNFITFLGCQAQLNYGIVGIIKGKVHSFVRDAIFDKITSSKKKSFIGQVYSGICIMNKELLNIKFKNFLNFEKEFYPIVISRYKSDFDLIKGYWHSIDNIKDIEQLKKNNSKNKFNETLKLKKKIIYN